MVNSLAKILLPVDFSERSSLAVRYARDLALHFGSELTLAHVLPPLHSEIGIEVAGSMLVDVYRSRTAQAESDLNAFERDGLAGLNVRRLLLHGDPATRIVELAREESFNLIAMPTHGYGPFRRFILGSVDLGPQSARALAWADWLRQQFQGHLTLMHAIAGHAESLDEPDVSWRRGIREAAEEELRRLLGAIDGEADLLLEAGEPARVICSAAARVGAGTVVIGRGSAAGDFGRLRTNSYAIIRQSPCPVVSV
jgi:nucleotide-binding universal stress UspA family protein